MVIGLNDFYSGAILSAQSAATLAMANTGNKKILLVDDRAAVRESLRIILSLEDDFEVVGEAENGREAVDLALSLLPHIVLTDLEMPDPKGETFDGINVCEGIKNKLPGCKVIILTVHGDKGSRQRAATAGCDLFLEKGINSFELLDQLRTLDGQHQV
jgi:two-component system, NarL family, response regulator DesR